MEIDDYKCPTCAEVIKREAIKCRFCGEKLTPPIAKSDGLTSKKLRTQPSGKSNKKLEAIVGILFAGWLLWQLLAYAIKQVDFSLHPEHEKQAAQDADARLKVEQANDWARRVREGQEDAERNKHNVKVGEEGTIEGQALVFDTLESHDQSVEATVSKDKIGFEKLFNEGHAYCITSKTRVLVLTTKAFSSMSEVRILDGVLQGNRFWILSQDITKN